MTKPRVKANNDGTFQIMMPHRPGRYYRCKRQTLEMAIDSAVLHCQRHYGPKQAK